MGLLSLLALPKHPWSPGLGDVGVLDGVGEAVSEVWGAVGSDAMS